VLVTQLLVKMAHVQIGIAVAVVRGHRDARPGTSSGAGS
jgi:hypothetical protein